MVGAKRRGTAVSAARQIPDSVRLKQAQASDPRASAFVAANAGAGKTHVLADRVIRLLLDGTDPAKILCITFTKAAAANMATRVFDRLKHWATLDDSALDRAIADIGERRPDDGRRAFARRLFARALETPGGLKVQTIHALCTRLLQQFPFEANVAARFAVLDDRSERQALERAMVAVLLEAAAAPDTPGGRALAAIVPAAADTTFRDVIREAVGRRDEIEAWLDAAGGLVPALAQLSRTLGTALDDSVARVEAELLAQSPFSSAEWPDLISIFATGAKSDRDHVARIEAQRSADPRRRLDAYLEIFCTASLSPRKNIVTRKIADAHPALLASLLEEQRRVCALLDRRRALMTRDRSAALITIAHAVIVRYRAEKDRRGLLDYDDLIDKTLALLTTVPPTWVHYKLDLGIEHVLIDEAQDTSPRQWQIIRTLTADFAAGFGARPERHRTLFAVGDEKQSIFSFQGAAPRQFDEMRRHFGKAFRAAALEWRDVRFEHSFRSGENILAGVETVFSRQEIFRSVTADETGLPPHQALPGAVPGLVELWDLCEPEDKPLVEPWRAPLDAVSETSPQVRLAERIATTVAGLCRDGRRAGEVLILVRQRGALFNHVIRALKNARIPVAGADRLILTDHIAIEDLLALADALLLPDDDLALAVALKSPLFGLDEDELFLIARDRRDNLRQALRDKAPHTPRLAAALALLERCEAQAALLRPFAFFAWLLGAERGRARILARLGHEAADPLDEFLQALLDFEGREIPSLQGFVNWLRSADTEIKRDMEMARDEVRVMTVHGAKGLEAPIVILADTTTQPKGPRPPRLLRLPQPGAPGLPSGIIWVGPKADDVGIVADARDIALAEAEDEYRRLLYVAMTRASERLIVCGVGGRTPGGCWYDLVHQAFDNDPRVVVEDVAGERIRRFRKVHGDAGPTAAAETGGAAVALPSWLRQAVASPGEANVVINPSRLDLGLDIKTGQRGRAAALRRGRIVHRLLQSLPDVAVERRAEVARRYLERFDLEAADVDALQGRVLAIVSEGRFAPLFAPGSRSEVAVIGTLPTAQGAVRIQGQIDRLAVTDGLIWIGDYKTGAPAEQPDEVPAYVAQLALYGAVLRKLYPAHALRACLVFVDGPTLLDVSEPTLDDALRRLTSP
jgi:ATP-dependent helicase/nuclease subunit A